MKGESFFDTPMKNKEEEYENIIEIKKKNSDYTTVNLFN